MADELQDKYMDLISKFKKKLKQWGKSSEVVYNKQLDTIDIKRVSIILVGDNPGNDEREVERYFVGKTGIAARCFFKAEFAIVDFNKEVVVLNKTPIYTKESEMLRNVDMRILEETQEYMGKLIYEIQKLTKAKLCIVGFGGCRKNKKWHIEKFSKTRYCACFWHTIRTLYMQDKELMSKVYIYKHFSRMCFFDDIASNVKYEDYDSLENVVLELGRQYSKELFNE